MKKPQGKRPVQKRGHGQELSSPSTGNSGAATVAQGMRRKTRARRKARALEKAVCAPEKAVCRTLPFT